MPKKKAGNMGSLVNNLFVRIQTEARLTGHPHLIEEARKLPKNSRIRLYRALEILKEIQRGEISVNVEKVKL
jgi:hypothetical protein